MYRCCVLHVHASLGAARVHVDEETSDIVLHVCTVSCVH